MASPHVVVDVPKHAAHRVVLPCNQMNLSVVVGLLALTPLL
jgi:hypothetical protein